MFHISRAPGFVLAALAIAVSSHAASKCDTSGDGLTTVADVTAEAGFAIDMASVTHDLNGDVSVDVLDVQVVINAVLGSGCMADFPHPVILSLAPKAALAGTTFTMTVTGTGLDGTTLSFTPPLVMSPPVINPAGTSATFSLSPEPSLQGYFTLIAANGVWQSAATPQTGFLPSVPSFRTLAIAGTDAAADPDSDGLATSQELIRGTDPISHDTDGDGAPDGLEVLFASDPLDARSIPTPSSARLFAASPAFAVRNQTSPVPAGPRIYSASSITFSVRNLLSPEPQTPRTHSASGRAFSMRNLLSPEPQTPRTYSASGGAFSVRNLFAPQPLVPHTYLAASGPVAIRNLVSPVSVGTRTYFQAGPRFSVFNGPPGAMLRTMAAAVACLDVDRDGLCDRDELVQGTNPLSADTDNDGYPDGLERALGSDPLNPISIPDTRPPAYVATAPLSLQNTVPMAALPSRPRR